MVQAAGGARLCIKGNTAPNAAGRRVCGAGCWTIATLYLIIPAAQGGISCRMPDCNQYAHQIQLFLRCWRRSEYRSKRGLIDTFGDFRQLQQFQRHGGVYGWNSCQGGILHNQWQHFVFYRRLQRWRDAPGQWRCCQPLHCLQ